jgi:hypothetical protein
MVFLRRSATWPDIADAGGYITGATLAVDGGHLVSSL